MNLKKPPDRRRGPVPVRVYFLALILIALTIFACWFITRGVFIIFAGLGVFGLSGYR